MKLLVVVLNYRTPELTVDCLRSAVPQARSIAKARIVVTDNQSGDGSDRIISAAIAENGWADVVEFRALPVNGGFAYGNNRGIEDFLRSAEPPDYVLLLNPDTVTREGAVPELLSYMEKNPTVGIAGSRLEDPDGTPQRSAFRFPGIASEIENGLKLGLVSRLLSRYVVAPPVADHVCATDWVAGASMIVRRAVFDKIGLLDEKYFMYFEEVDFCLRAARAGFPCMYVPQSRVVHYVGQASGVTNEKTRNKRRPTYWFTSRRRYFSNNHGLVYAVLADICFALSHALWRLRRWLQGKPDPDPEKFLGDFLRNSVLVKGRS